jgi:hypothetical protein
VERFCTNSPIFTSPFETPLSNHVADFSADADRPGRASIPYLPLRARRPAKSSSYKLVEIDLKKDSLDDVPDGFFLDFYLKINRTEGHALSLSTGKHHIAQVTYSPLRKTVISIGFKRRRVLIL